MKINSKWDLVLKDEFEKEYFKNIISRVNCEYISKIIYPEYSNIFNAFKLTDYDKVKVVILGQDPYHGDGEAHGLSFSVREGIRRPPSLNNIFKELKDDLGIYRVNNDLSDWGRQGVLLLNSILTVEKDKAASHKDIGWEIFTDNVIKKLNERDEPIVFILWGNYARSKKVFITNKKHYIIESNHPSPLSASRGFFGSKPFSKTNDFLIKNNLETIKW